MLPNQVWESNSVFIIELRSSQSLLEATGELKKITQIFFLDLHIRSFLSHKMFLTCKRGKNNESNLILYLVRKLSSSPLLYLLSCVLLFGTPWTVACQAPLSSTISRRLLKLMSIESVVLSNHLILCHPLLLLPSIFPSIRIFFSESALGGLELP